MSLVSCPNCGVNIDHGGTFPDSASEVTCPFCQKSARRSEWKQTSVEEVQRKVKDYAQRKGRPS